MAAKLYLSKLSPNVSAYVDLRDLIAKPKESIIQNQDVKELTLFDEL